MVEEVKDNNLKGFLKEPSFREVVLIFGLISLFGDILYEGARPILVTYLDTIGQTVLIISIGLGLAEFLGFLSRVVSGVITDKYKLYWSFIFIGYGMLIAIPLIGFTTFFTTKNSPAYFWLFVVVLYALERIGKGIYAPSEDAVFSSIAKGSLGKAFGWRELLDQTGAVVGPIILSAILYYKQNDFFLTFSFFYLPFFIIIILVYLSWRRLGGYSAEKMQLDIKKHENEHPEEGGSIPKAFHIYGLAIFFNALGLVYVFTFIAFITIVAGPQQYWLVALFYGVIMLVQGLVSPVLGYVYDKYGRITAVIPFIVAVVPALTLINNSLPLLLIGCIFFGITLSGQDTVFKAIVGDFITHKRGTAYSFYFGYLNTGLFISAIIFGYLVEQNLQNYAWIFSVIFEVIAFILLFYSISLKNKSTVNAS